MALNTGSTSCLFDRVDFLMVCTGMACFRLIRFFLVLPPEPVVATLRLDVFLVCAVNLRLSDAESERPIKACN